MFQRVATALLLTVVVAAARPAQVEAQAAPNPTQQTVATPQGEIPVFRVTVVGRTVPAINYRPRSGDTRINFGGTALMPKAKGWASVEGEKGYIKIDARFDELDAPQRFGREYLTYVLWAITPEGRATNLGELQVNGNDGRLEASRLPGSRKYHFFLENVLDALAKHRVGPEPKTPTPARRKRAR